MWQGLEEIDLIKCFAIPFQMNNRGTVFFYCHSVMKGGKDHKVTHDSMLF